MSNLTKDQAEALASIIVPALKEHATATLSSLTDEQKNEMHPQAFAALETLSGIRGSFCEIAPEIDKSISGIGWFARSFLGHAYAMLLVFQTVIKDMQSALCPAAAPKK